MKMSSDSSSAPSISLDPVEPDLEDLTILQGVFQPDTIEPDDSSTDEIEEDLTDSTMIQGGVQIDSLTGQIIEADLDLSPEERVTSEDQAVSTHQHRPESPDPSWDTVADPWD